MLWKRMNQFRCNLAQVVYRARAWNGQLQRSGGQRSRSRSVEICRKAPFRPGISNCLMIFNQARQAHVMVTANRVTMKLDLETWRASNFLLYTTEYCYLMTTFRCPSDILITSWLFTARWSTWPGNHLVPCVAEMVRSCIPIHVYRGLPDPKCLFHPSGLSLCLSVDHFCLVPVDDMVLFHGMVCDGWLVPTAQNGAQRYEQFLQDGWLYQALILLGLAVCLPSTSVSLVFVVLYINVFCLHPSLYLLVSWAWWDWPLTWLTNHRPSVLWHCWLVMWSVKSSPKWPIMCRVGR